jgi:RHS repeat-associated protein
VHAAVQQVKNKLRFQRQYYDEESGLHYIRHSYYDPECGRFINQGPIGLLDGDNNYLYVPNPVSWVDPQGMNCKEYNSTDAAAFTTIEDKEGVIPWDGTVYIPKFSVEVGH